MLFTKDIDKKLFAQYQMGADLENQMVVAKIFNPYGRGTWYLLNSDPSDPDYLWAIVDLFEVETGSVSRSELESIKVPPFGLHLERDSGFTPINAAELYKGLMAGKHYAEGGEITEYQGTKAYTVNFKTYRNFPAAWRVIFFWGNTKPFVEVTKVTNNPFGGRLGKDFDTLDKAIAHYKSPEMKVLLLQAGDVAKKAGVPMDMFAKGGYMAKGGEFNAGDNLLLNISGKETIIVLMKKPKEGRFVNYVALDKEGKRIYGHATIMDYDIFLKSIIKKMEGGGMMAKGGMIKVGGKVGFLRPNTGRYEYAEVLEIDGDKVSLVVRHPKRSQWDNFFTESKDRLVGFTKTSSEDWKDGRPLVKFMADGGEISSFEKKIKDALKVENKWHFINEEVDGKNVQLKMFVGKKEVDVQIFRINGLGAKMPRNYVGKRETLKMIMDNFEPKMLSEGGSTSSPNSEFMKWFVDWSKSVNKYVYVSITKPNEFSSPIKDNNDKIVILDVIEKKGDADAKKYFNEILKKADEFGVSIYLEPIPRTQNLKSEEHKKKITKDYLIKYYQKFGFENTDGGFMVRAPKMEGGAMMAKGGATFGSFGSGRLNKNAWVAANYIGDSKVELGELQSYLERNTNEEFDKDKIYTITRTLYKSGDYVIDDNKDWKLSKIYRKKKMTDGGWIDDVTREMEELKKKYPKSKVTYFFAKNPNGKNYVIEVKEENKVIYTTYDDKKMAMGGAIKFKDKVASIKASQLKRKRVPKVVQKDYGKTFSPAEAEDSAKRIVGAQTAKERLMMRIKSKKKK